VSRALSFAAATCAAVLATLAPVSLQQSSAAAAPAHPVAGHTAAHRAADVITGHATELYPEGVAWDPTRRAFLVGSASQGNLSVIGQDGSVKELAPSIGKVSTLGIRVDVARNRILVAYSDFWVRQRLDVGDQPPTSGVAVFALDTGELKRRVDVAGGRERTFANDLTVDRRGNIYVTDSVYDTVQRIGLDGKVSPVATDPRFAADIVGLNGIVWHPDGYLLAVRYDTGAMFRITPGAPADRRVREVRLPRPLVGTDGLGLRADGSLIVVTNSIGAAVGVPGGVDAVTTLDSDDGWRSAGFTTRVDPWPTNGPTTVAVTPFGDYALSGEVGELLAGRVSDLITLRRIPTTAAASGSPTNSPSTPTSPASEENDR
jgi:sugar lactone lactonase YvrE